MTKTVYSLAIPHHIIPILDIVVMAIVSPNSWRGVIDSFSICQSLAIGYRKSPINKDFYIMTVPPPSSTASPHYDLLIIGAGIAGLAAGRMAQQAGLKVMLIDKGRRVGGRVSTRRIDGFVFNHGAQFATSKSSDFRDILRAASTAGTATNWQIEDKKTVVIGTPMMRAIPMFLADNLPIQQNRRIARIIRKTDHIQCVDTDDVPVTAKKVICTAPAPQTAALLTDDFPDLAATASHAAYAPCLTVMLGLADDELLPKMPVKSPQHDIGWAMCETARPDAAQHRPALTIQADAAWSAAHKDDRTDSVIKQLIEKYQLATECQIGEVLHAHAHRWLYAKVTTPSPADAIICQKNLAIAGDWLGGARIEHAFISGQRAFMALHPTHARPSI
jgi:renalase